jgi:phenylacetate-CoA ligase
MNIFKIAKHYQMFMSEQWLDKDSMAGLEEKRLREIFSHARNTKHYRKLLASPCPGLPEIPITTKEMMRNDPDSFLPEGVSKNSLHEIRTSGSTGTPLSIFFDQNTEDRRIAKEYFVECVMGRSPFEEFAHITTIPYIPHRLLSLTGIFKKTTLSPYVEEEKNLAVLRRSRVRTLRAFPSTLSILAKINQNDPIALKSIISTGEVLTDENRKTIEDSFSCPVLESYGTMEFRTIAFQCPERKKFHVDCSSLIVEITDEKGKPKKSGQGEVVVTSFHNTPMTFIRYPTGDLARWGKECPCGRGSPVLESIEGRKTNVFMLPSGKVRPFGALYIALNQINVLSFQVIQERTDLFVFRYVPLQDDLSNTTNEEIKRKISAACLDEKIIVEFERVDSINRGGRGKHRYIVSKVK